MPRAVVYRALHTSSAAQLQTRGLRASFRRRARSGQVLHSKLKSGRFPEPSEVIAKLSAVVKEAPQAVD